MRLRALASVAWPSFLVAGVAQSLFFTLFDPADMSLFGSPVELGRTAVYSIGFFLFWAVCAASSALTSLLLKSAAEINRCPLEPEERPVGCPKREEP